MQNRVHNMMTWRQDIFAGLSVAAIALPAQMATAHLAGFPVIYGLYVFVVSSLGFFIFGSNRYLSCGADSTIAPIFAVSLASYATLFSVQYMALASLLALLVGAILLGVYVFKLGWVANLLSYPVTLGFLAGVSIHIIVSQLPSILGLPHSSASPFQTLYHLAQHITQLNLITTFIGGGVFAFIFWFSRQYKRFPAALIALAISITIEIALNAKNIDIPTLSNPAGFELHWAFIGLPWHQALTIFPLALLIAMICIVQTSAVSSTIKDRNTTPNFNRDFAGIGLGSVLSGLIGGFPGNASPPRSMLIQQGGAHSKWAALFSAAVICGVLLYAQSAFHLIPKATLSGILVYVGLSIFKWNEIKRIYHQNRQEFYLCLTTILMIVTFRIDIGVMFGVFLSLLHSIFIITRPNCEELFREPHCDHWGHRSRLNPEHNLSAEEDVAVLHFSAPLYFTTFSYFEERILNLANTRPLLRLVIIDASSISDMDLTAVDKIEVLNQKLAHRNVTLLFVNIEHPRFRRLVKTTDLLTILGQKTEYTSIEAAITACR
ncbi:SulP family inorganic anion transporter [Photobacterium sp. S4TG1]|uniref:SulP family inorganic anion transporter n=1 Tax=Photobacterium sp. S4TG1 TaxID=3114587 RepID=UPI002E170557|nr:SulP family inorganic anion transporter [Photobacterium sp. S4TG1]